MKRLLKLAAAGGLLLSVNATPAQAACSQVYGGSSFGTCASATITSFYDAALGMTRVTVNFGNWGDLGEVFTAFGLHSFGAGTTLYGTGNFMKAGSLSSWELSTNGAGFGDLPTLRYIAGTNGVGGGLGNGQTGWFSFDLSGDFSNYVFDDWGVHAQSGPNGCSTKLIVTNGTPNTPTGFSGETPCASTSTPEPATMILLGTGLVGVFGGAAARRKRQG